jgi:hypothetical protein
MRDRPDPEERMPHPSRLSVRLLQAVLRAAMRGRSSPERLAALKRLADAVYPGYRLGYPDLDWWGDPRFDRYLADAGEADGFNAQRRFAVLQLARLVAGVPGDTAECGVFRGAGSRLILAATANGPDGPREHHLFDSFEGLSNPGAEDGEYWRRGDLACSVDSVRAALSEFPGVRFHPGWIPDRFPEVADRRFAFVHVDVDLYQPTRDSVEFFYPRLSPGGILLCDDYGFTTCPGATRAVDEALEGRPERFVSLPDGGGFLIKGTVTAAPVVLGA